MLRIGVQMPSRLGDAGEYLADARALDAAGADSLWLDGEGDDPWLVLAAMAAVTGRVRLVTAVSASDARPVPALARRAATLGRLSRGRVALVTPASELVDVVRDAVRCPILLDTLQGAPEPETTADGVLDRHDSPETCGRSLRRILESRRLAHRDGPFELWTPVPFPADRPSWRRVLAGYDAAGATGVIVPAGPRLLDLLRNPDEDDDRSDLALAQG